MTLNEKEKWLIRIWINHEKEDGAILREGTEYDNESFAEVREIIKGLEEKMMKDNAKKAVRQLNRINWNN